MWRAGVLVAVLLGTASVCVAGDPRADARADLVAAIQAYRSALDRLVGFHEAAATRAAMDVEQRRTLLSRGIISRRDLEDSERALAAAEAKLAQTRREMVIADQSLAEALIPPSAPKPDPRIATPGRQVVTPMLVRFTGPARWSLAEMPKIETFFSRRFGRPLPVSAVGQTPLHDRLGFDHHDAVDVAVMPDSPEGTALMAYLRSAGFSFMAFRGAVPGEATGAHIHIGGASRRISY